MGPRDLRIENFERYPPRGRSFAGANLNVLKRIPAALLPLVLRQIIRYDWCFPPEKLQLSQQLDYLGKLDAASFDRLMSPFVSIPLSSELVRMNWVDQPQQFSEQLTAYLWSQDQIDAYHKAVLDYQERLQRALDPMLPATPRWTIVVVGKGTDHTARPLFRRLMSHGTLFTEVDPKDGFDTLLQEVGRRVQQHPAEYGHWYIDGGDSHPVAAIDSALTVMSYNSLVPATKREFGLLNQFTSRSSRDGGAGVEAVTSYIAGLTPDDMGLKGTMADAPLRHFEVNILTQGAGCQIFSTTFVQWSARECLHRAQPITLLARFTTRQSNAPMEQLMAHDPLQQPQDREGSLVDADMGAYYTWINQSRLAGAEESRFLAWYEDHSIACAIAPTLPRGKTSSARANVQQILEWMR
jgi:hypothetical protein